MCLAHLSLQQTAVIYTQWCLQSGTEGLAQKIVDFGHSHVFLAPEPCAAPTQAVQHIQSLP